VAHDFKSKRCADCGFTFYMNAAAAVVALIENERGELLVARRAEEPARGTLDLIGGFVDAGETLEEALRREVEEETGVRLEAGAVLGMAFSLPNVYLFSGLEVQTTDAFFRVRLRSDVALRAHDDVAACWWARPEDLRLEDFGLASIRRGVERACGGSMRRNEF